MVLILQVPVVGPTGEIGASIVGPIVGPVAQGPVGPVGGPVGGPATIGGPVAQGPGPATPSITVNAPITIYAPTGPGPAAPVNNEMVVRHIYEYPPAPPGGWPLLPSSSQSDEYPSEPPPPVPRLPPIDVSDIPDSGRVEVIEDISVPEVNLNVKRTQTTNVRNYFTSHYYFLLNIIYQVLNEYAKQLFNNNLRETTDVFVRSENPTLSDTAYKRTVKSLRINETVGGGNCFFAAVADALNIHNRVSPFRRIQNTVQGNNNYIFTQQSIRQYIANYYTSLPNLDFFIQRAADYTQSLNKAYSKDIQQQIAARNPVTDPEIDYLQEAVRIYRDTNYPNFLVKFPEERDINIDNLALAPFRPINKREVENYILSPNYWAGQEAIMGLIETLNINTILIQPVNRDGVTTYQIIQTGLLTTQQYNNWDKYIFLYYTGDHYDLITFNYINVPWNYASSNGRPLLGSLTTTTIGLFYRDIGDKLPPLYILFLMYVTSYRILSTEMKRNYSVFPEIMNGFDISLDRIASSPPPRNKTDVEWDQILKQFTRYFSDKFPPPIKPFQRVIRPDSMSGGAVSSRNQQQQRYYGKPYYAANMVNKNQEYDPSKLAYSINIYMELYPGTSIPEDELKKLQCTSKWNAVRKAWADFTGKPYVIKPVYSMLDKNKTQNNRNVRKNTNAKNNTNVKNNANVKNNTNVKQGGRSKTCRKK